MRSRWLGCLLVAAVAVACAETGEENPSLIGGGLAGNPGATPGGGTTGGAVPGGGTTGGQPDSGILQPSTTGGTGGTTGGIAGGGGNVIPCDVQKILKEKCQTCHADQPVGAPMALTTLAHFKAPSGSKPAETNWQRAKARINEPAATAMPPYGRPALTAAEKTTLDAFLSATGVQGVSAASAGSCGAPPTTGSTAGTGGTTGGGTPGGTPGGWTTQKCDYEMSLLAHQGQTAGDTTPYNVTKSGDSYEIFWFTPTWNEKVHAIDIQPVIDNGAILHHWLLYMKEKGTEANGSHNPDSGLQSADSALLSGWAPGNKSFQFGNDLGMQVIQGSNARFGIEIHYNTSANPANRKDRSGARLCLTKTLRPKEAATHWLGTQAIIGFGKFDALGTCSVKQTSHIIAHSPHMHKTGRYMKTIVTKKSGGAKVTITDKPFAFDDQQIYPVEAASGEIVVEPGDIINTTCSYDSALPITFGPGTADEMCYNFVIAWPAGSLSNGAAGIVGGKNTCIDGI